MVHGADGRLGDRGGAGGFGVAHRFSRFFFVIVRRGVVGGGRRVRVDVAGCVRVLGA